ncbi:uncharacterized protein DSM5745_00445 [Aspergillus mulundensis]|uniref:F-box domain-containing protein n=1 Tax=Aspergillus mulundensis TaxID=1810919 RepID=A0A3D8T3K0_9EURO|nr:hypothetical protein DSM5745_00445 [Aspergillus mulundensis]RDW93123.1 hypothetical protein DSM5745_00445 [Aspergillus mulundensis]
MSETRPSAVFFIRELLEPILLQTDFRTIILAQRVCRFWNSLVQSSDDLQVAIWLKPYPENRLGGGMSQPRLNPLICDSIWGFVPRGCPCELAPPSQAAKRDEASWRRMLITQPPWKDIAITELNRDRGIVGSEGPGPFYTLIRLDRHNDPFRLGQLCEDLKNESPRTKIMWHSILIRAPPPVGYELGPCYLSGSVFADIIIVCNNLSYSAQDMGGEQEKEKEKPKILNIERWLQSAGK